MKILYAAGSNPVLRKASDDAERSLGATGQFSKRWLVEHRQVSQHLTVNFDGRPIQPIDHPAVRQAVIAGAGVDAGDPQRTEFALLLATVAISILACLLYTSRCV